MDKHVQFWVEKTINEMEFTEREGAVSNLLREKNALFNLYIGCAERIVKALFLMNAGGVVTILTYLHGNTIQKDNPTSFYWIYASLIVFLIGLLCTFIVVGYDYLVVLSLYRKYNNQSQQFYDNKIPFYNIEWFKGMRYSFWARFAYVIFVWLTGGIAFLFAIAGILLGLYGYHLGLS